MTDWFKGMVSLFDFCQKEGIAFKIHSKQKFNFEDFFLPNDYNWVLSDEEYANLKHDPSSLHLCLSESGIEGSEVWTEQQTVLRIICGTRRVRAIFIHGVAAYGLPAFGQRFRTLFSMSPLLNKSVSSMLHKISGRYISVSYRFVNLLHDSYEEVSGIDAISLDEQSLLISKCIDELRHLLDLYKDMNVLVTTDSYNFLSALDECSSLSDRVFYMKGEKVHRHLGFSSEVSMEGMLKSYTEFMLISHAEEAFLVKIGPMYESKFPKWAATINGIPYSIISVA